jgi:hypothetical protein
MNILEHIIDESIITGISPLMKSTNNDGARRIRFFVYTDRYPIVIETKPFYEGFGTDEKDYPEILKHYTEAHARASAQIFELIEERNT